MAKPPAAEQVQVNFRMPVELRDSLRNEAEKKGRSLNAEIVFRLERSLADESDRESLARQMAELQSEMTERIDALADKIALEYVRRKVQGDGSGPSS
jgi:hypothetical protein